MTSTAPTPSAWVTHPWVAEGERRLRFGLVIVGRRASWSSYFDWVRRAEALGFDSFWVQDHPMKGIECWTALAAIAARGTSLRLGSFVSSVYYRNPALLARLAADVDCLSDGKLVLGVGIGDNAGEFAQMALPVPSVGQRQRALAETVEIVRGMWAGAPFTYQGEQFGVSGAAVRPPVQQPRLPILIAGGGERVTLGQVARYADVSNFGPTSNTGRAASLEDIRRKCASLREHCQALGRPYESILRSYIVWSIVAAHADAVEDKVNAVAPSLSPTARQGMFVGTASDMVAYWQGLAEAGLRYFIVAVNEDDHETAELIGAKVIPSIGGA